MQGRTISMSVRVNTTELDKFKQAAELLNYSSYSEFVRRTALIEADRVIREHSKEQEGERSQC